MGSHFHLYPVEAERHKSPETEVVPARTSLDVYSETYRCLERIATTLASRSGRTINECEQHSPQALFKYIKQWTQSMSMPSLQLTAIIFRLLHIGGKSYNFGALDSSKYLGVVWDKL